jgi:hypothetical protein
MHAPFRQSSRRPQQIIPDTLMAHAYLKALAHLAARQVDCSTQVILPTGPADIGEVELVLRALGRIRNDTNRKTKPALRGL